MREGLEGREERESRRGKESQAEFNRTNSRREGSATRKGPREDDRDYFVVEVGRIRRRVELTKQYFRYKSTGYPEVPITTL